MLHVSPPVTTVHVPTIQIGYGTAAALLAGIRGTSHPARSELAIELIVRRSTCSIKELVA